MLTATLSYANSDLVPLETITMTYGAVRRYFPTTISFSPRRDPPETAYRLSLAAGGDGLQVFGRAEDVYVGGDFSLDNQPQPADAAFRTSYEYGLLAVLGDLGATLRGSWLVIPLLLALWLPGWLLLRRWRG